MVAAAMAVVVGVVAWHTMPVPERVDHVLIRQGMVLGLAYAVVMGGVGALIVLYLVAQAFGSFTGW